MVQGWRAFTPLLVGLVVSLAHIGLAQAAEDGAEPQGARIPQITAQTPTKLSVDQQASAPAIYASKPRDWGCCRLCLARELPKARKTQFKPTDPSRLVNCCPICPWPKKAKKKLGPFTYYFQKHEPSPLDQYEAHLGGFAPGAPAASGETPAAAASAAAGDGDAADGGGGDGSLLEVVPLHDAYAAMRGNEMNRWENYMYGFPGDPVKVDAPRKPDMPPCCNFCTRVRDSLAVKGNPGCCMQCSMTYVAARQHFPRRTFRDRDKDGMPALTGAKAQRPQLN